MEWEKPYLEALIDALKPSGDVLQIGFGHGYAADRIQTFKPKSHTIVDADADAVKRAKEWNKKHSHSTILQKNWQAALAELGTFDAIFFDDFSLRKNPIAIQSEQCAQGALFLQKGKELIDSVQSQFPEMTKIHYSDADIDDLYRKSAQFHRDVLPRFLAELQKNGQISDEQYEKALVKYKIARLEPTTAIAIAPIADPAFAFVEECLRKHLRKKGKISWFSNSSTSRYADPKFSERIIANADLNYQERSMGVQPPADCDYFKGSEGLVCVIEKIA